MKLKNYLAILPLALVTLGVSAETANTTEPKEESGSVFHFSTQVTRHVEKDLMHADVYSRKSGKNLAELKKNGFDRFKQGIRTCETRFKYRSLCRRHQ